MNDAEVKERLHHRGASRSAAALRSGITSAEALDYLRHFAATWADAGAPEQADLIHAVYERIEVSGASIVGVTLTPDAERHGVSLALPERVNVRSLSTVAKVGGEGLEPPTSSV